MLRGQRGEQRLHERGASRKLGLRLPEAEAQLRRLGGGLRWHGALSADVILTPDGPVVIDVNPRLVEPVNALLSGVDLVTPLLDLARGRTPSPQSAGRAGVATHQLLLAVLGAAEHTGRRRAVLGELAGALLRRGGYAGSAEELTPGPDARAALLLAAMSGLVLARPRAWRRFATGSVTAYALSPEGWERILGAAPA